jgi:hypothetical protein
MPESTSMQHRQASWAQVKWCCALLALMPLFIGCQQTRTSDFPIGIYSVPLADLGAVRAAGFNIVRGAATREYLDSAHQLGLQVLASPGSLAGPRFKPEAAREAVASFDKHPALWAWYIADEPDLNGTPPEEVRKMSQVLKKAGARKPTALVIYQGRETLFYGNIADITMIDRYPVPWLPLANFPQHVRLARLGVGKDKPLIAVIQAFDWSYYPALLPGGRDLRPPTYEELRCMTYSALAQRATGLFYYCYNDGAWKMPEHADTWQALTRVVGEVHSRLPLFEAEHLWWHCVHEYPNEADGFNEALDSSVTPALLRVREGNASVSAGDYLLAVNTTARMITYRVRLPRSAAGQIQTLGEDRALPVIRGWIEDDFGPFEVRIYGPMPPH